MAINLKRLEEILAKEIERLTLRKDYVAGALLSEVLGLGLNGSLRFAKGRSSCFSRVLAALGLIVTVEISNSRL